MYFKVFIDLRSCRLDLRQTQRKLMTRLASLALIILVGCVRIEGAETPAQSTGVESPKLAEAPVAAAPQVSEMSEMILLTVDKDDLRAELKTWPANLGESRTLSQFTIAVGKEKGDKQREGDNRTPEGIYFTESVIDGEKLPEKYGPKAIPINFPNPMDRRLKKSGYGIWLHGVENNSRIEEANVTEGCVAFYNEDIGELAHWLKPHQGLVVIASDTAEVNRDDDVRTLRERTEAWANSWKQRSLDEYISYYDDSFRFKGLDIAGFRDYKRNVFASYKSMTVEFGEIRVVTHPKYAISFMNQDFDGDGRFTSRGRKILYWQKDAQGLWKIADEIHEDRRVEHLNITPDALASLTRAANTAKAQQKPQSSTSNL
jgi:murein L,D-transpeptidase YafK